MEGRMTDIYHSMTNRAPGKRQIKWQEHNVLSLIQEEYDEDNDEDFLAAEDPNSSSGSDDEDQYVDENSSEGNDGDEKETPSPDIPSTSKASTSTSASNKPSTSNATPAIKKKRITSKKGKKRRRNDISKEAQEEGEAVNAVRKITSRMEKGGSAQALKLRKIQSQVDKTKSKVLKNFVDNGAEICQVCLRGSGSSGKVREILICSNCGTSIHPECYSPNKKCISKSRKMWFCERCMSKSHPNCQLCPTTKGYMKETSNNQWFHIICARYLFRGKLTYMGENDSIIDVSSLSYKLYGAKECILCEEPLMAKTGICIPCDAGMCRNYFHVTCAQRYGLLAQQNSNFYSEVNDVCCPLHSREEIYQPLQKRFFMATALTSLRLSKFEKDRKDSRDRRERSLNEQHEVFVKKKSIRPVILPFDGPPPPRPLHSCASALRNLNEKAKLHFGLNSLNPAICLLTPHEIRKGRHVPPSLSGQFVHHFIDRHLRIQETHERVELDNKLHEDLSNHEQSFMGDRGGFQAELTCLDNELKSVDEEAAVIDVLDESMKNWVSANKSTISSINSHLFTMSNQKQRTRILKPLEVARMVEVARNEDQSPPQKENPKEEPGPSSASSSLIIMSPGAVSTSSDVIFVEPKSPVSVELHTCRKCGSDSQQHLMLECGVCSGWFHLRCCEPPMTVMPRKNKFFVWQCAECDASEEETDPLVRDEIPEVVDGSPEANTTRGRLKKRLRTESRKYSPDNYQRPKKSKARTSREYKLASDETTPTSLKESLKPISPRIELHKCNIQLLLDATPTSTKKEAANKPTPRATESQPTTSTAAASATSAANETTTESSSSVKLGKLKRRRRGIPLTAQARRRRRTTVVKRPRKKKLEEKSSSVVEEAEQSVKDKTSEKEEETAELVQQNSIQQRSIEDTETTSAPTAANTDRYDRVITISATPVGDAVVVSPGIVKEEKKNSPPSSQITNISATTIEVAEPSSHTTKEEATAQKQKTTINKSSPTPPAKTKRARKGKKPTRIVAAEDPLASIPAKRKSTGGNKKGKNPAQPRKLATPTKVEFISIKVAPAPQSSLMPKPPIDLATPTAESSPLENEPTANSWDWPRKESRSSKSPVRTPPVQTAESSMADLPVIDLTSSPPPPPQHRQQSLVASIPHYRLLATEPTSPLPPRPDRSASTTSNPPTSPTKPNDESDEKKMPSTTATAGDGKEAALRKETPRSPVVFPLPVQQLAKSRSPPRVVDDSKLKQFAAIATASIGVLDNTTTTPETSVVDVTTTRTSSPVPVAEVAAAPERIAHPSTLAARKKAMKRKTAEWKAAAKVKSDLIEKEQQQEEEEEGRQSPPADHQTDDSDLRSPQAKRIKTIASIQELRHRGGGGGGGGRTTTAGSSRTNNRVQDTTTSTPISTASPLQINVQRKRVGEINPSTMTASQILRSAKTPDPNQRSTFRLVQSLSETRADSKRQKLMEKHSARLASPVILSPPRRPTKLTIQTTTPAIIPNSTSQSITSNNTKETTHIVVAANQSVYKRVVYTAQGGGKKKNNEPAKHHIPKEAIRLAKTAANSDQINSGELHLTATTTTTLLKSSLGRINLQSAKSSPIMSTPAVMNGGGGGGGGVQFTRTHSGLFLLSPGSGGSPMMEPVKAITVLENGSSNHSSPASVENKTSVVGISEDSLKKLKTTSTIISTKPLTSRPVIVNPPRIISFKDGSLTDSSKSATNIIKPHVIATKSTPAHGRSTIPCTAAFKQNKQAVAGDTLLSPTISAASSCFSFPMQGITATDFTASPTLVTVGPAKVIDISTNEPSHMRNIIRSPLDVTLVSNGDATASTTLPTPSSVDDEMSVTIARSLNTPSVMVRQIERKPDLDASIIDLCGDDDEAVMMSPRSVSYLLSSEPPPTSAATVTSSGDNDAPPKAKPAPKEEMVATCAECKKTDSMDNMQACCDCDVIRHTQCWDPPLGNGSRYTKRKTKRFFSWQCSECLISKAKKKEAENAIEADNDDDSGGRKRSTRKRKTPDHLWQEMQMAQMMKTPKNRITNRSRPRRKSSVNKLVTEPQETPPPSQNSIKPPALVGLSEELLANDDIDDVTQASGKRERDGSEDVAALRDHDYHLLSSSSSSM